MRLFWSFLILLFPLILAAQIEIESQEINSESDNGLIRKHGNEALLNVWRKNSEGNRISLLLPQGNAIQGSAVSIGYGVAGFGENGVGLQGYSQNNYGVHAFSGNSHGAYFRGSKGEGIADIILGASGINDNGIIMSDPGISGSDLFVVANDAVVAKIDKNNNSQGNFLVFDGNNDQLFQVDINGNVKVNGTTVHGSDRNRKEQINEVSNTDILNAIIGMPIYEWQVAYAEVSNLTFHSDIHLEFGKELVVVNDQTSLLFVKTKAGWKKVHEHHAPLKK